MNPFQSNKQTERFLNQQLPRQLSRPGAPASNDRQYIGAIVIFFSGSFGENPKLGLFNFFIFNFKFGAFHFNISRVKRINSGHRPLRGFFADRFCKRTVTMASKILEVAIMALVCCGLAGGSGRILLGFLLTGIFLMGTLAAFFSPSKYSLMPELLAQDKLS